MVPEVLAINRTVKITAVGNSTGVILPKDVLQRLRVDKGDQLYLVETAYGYVLTPYDPECTSQMDVAERVIREDRDTLRKPAE
jgi:putative addiction module antidote